MLNRFLLLALVAFGITACSSNPLEVKISHCPSVIVVGDMGTVTEFVGEGRTTEDVAYTASISRVVNSCDEGGDDVSQTVDFMVSAQTGPAFQGGRVDLTYFVIVAKDTARIISKETYDVSIAIGRDGRGGVAETITALVPTLEQARKYDYEVILGFQTDAENVVFNMRR